MVKKIKSLMILNYRRIKYDTVRTNAIETKIECISIVKKKLILCQKNFIVTFICHESNYHSFILGVIREIIL